MEDQFQRVLRFLSEAAFGAGGEKLTELLELFRAFLRLFDGAPRELGFLSLLKAQQLTEKPPATTAGAARQTWEARVLALLLRLKQLLLIEMADRQCELASLQAAGELPSRATNFNAELLLEPGLRFGYFVVAGGTLARLLEWQTSDREVDSHFVDCLLLLHPSFCTTDELLSALEARWASIGDSPSPPALAARLRVASFLKQLLERSPRLVLACGIDRILACLSRTLALAPDPASLALAGPLRALASSLPSAPLPRPPALPLTRPVPPPHTPAGDALSDLSPLELARQTCLHHFALFEALELADLCAVVWPQRFAHSTALRRLQDAARGLARWAAALLGDAVGSAAVRVGNLRLLLELAVRLAELRDYFGAFALLEGLAGEEAVEKTQLWAQVRKKHRELCSQYTRLQGVTRAPYEEYWAAMKAVEEPTVPALQPVVEALERIAQEEPDALARADVINIGKRVRVLEVVEMTLSWQKRKYALAVEKTVAGFVQSHFA